jgi:CRP-like cAMP-binding protein
MEFIDVVELFTQIDAAIEQSEPARALRLILNNFSKMPDAAPLRERVAEILADNEYDERAIEIYDRVGLHYANSGHPTRAISVARQIDRLGGDPSGLVDRFIALYNVRSPFLDRQQRHATFEAPDEPLDLSADGVDLPDDELADAASERALDAGHLAGEPNEKLPPIPLLSKLPSETLERVIHAIEHRRFRDVVPVMDPSATGGELIWTITGDMTIGQKDPTYRLPPGTMLGLNAFGASAVPAAQTVVARNGSEILSLQAEAIEALTDQFADFGNRLDNLKRHAFTESLLENHGLFEAVPKDERKGLLGRFRGVRIGQGTQIIDQDSPSPGLFLLLDGEVDIVREDEDWEITVETLGPGDVFGEVGLVSDRPTQANAVMSKSGHLLHLTEGDFESVASDNPGLAKFAVNLAQRRMDEMETTLSANDLAEIPE